MVRMKSQANPGELPGGNSVPDLQLSATEAGSRGLARVVSTSKALNGLRPDSVSARLGILLSNQPLSTSQEPIWPEKTC